MVMKAGLSASMSETAAAHEDAVEALRRMKKVRLDAGTKFRGVRRRRRRTRSGRYGAQIWDPLRRNNLWLGTFGSAVDAAKAYDAAAAELRGAAARTNFKIPAAEHGLSAGPAEDRGDGVEAMGRRSVRLQLGGTLCTAVKLRCARESKRCVKMKMKAVKKGAAGPYSRTGFWGVRTQSTGGYGAEIRDNKGKTYTWLGTFNTPVEAARAYDAAAVKLHGSSANINFKIPVAVQSSESVTAEGAQGQGLSASNCEIVDELGDGVGAVERTRKRKKEAASRPSSRTGPNSRTGFWGVRTQSSGKYGAEISSKGKGCTWLGTFDTAEEAARAYDAAAVKLHGSSAKTNCKIPMAVQSSESVTAEGAQGQGLSAGSCEIVDELGGEVGAVERRKKKTLPDAQTEFRCVRPRPSGTAEDAAAGKLPCVKKVVKEAACRPYSRTGFWGVRRTRTGRYGAEIRDNKGKTYTWLGTFDNPEEAARAYDAAAVKLHGASANINFKIPVAVQSSDSVTGEGAQGQGLSTGNCEVLEELVDGVEAEDRRKKCGAAAETNFKIPMAVQSSASVMLVPAESAQGQDMSAGNCEIAEEHGDSVESVERRKEKLHGPAAETNFKIPVAVQSSASVTTMVPAESAQGQGLSVGNCELTEEHRDSVEAVEMRNGNVLLDARTEFTAEAATAVKLPCRKKETCRLDSRTGFRGVRRRPSGRYMAEIIRDKICRRLGTFDHAEEAARAYDAAAIELHGAAAKTNFKIPVAVQSSTSVTMVPAESTQVTMVPAESTQGQGLSDGNCEITEEHRDSVEAVEMRKEKVLLDARTEFTAEAAAAVKLPCRKKETCRLDSRTVFRGVRRRSSGRYMAEIIRDKVYRQLGTFDTAEEAARAYDVVAIELHGAATKTNFKNPAAPIADDIDPGLPCRKKETCSLDSRTGFRGVRRRPSGKYMAEIIRDKVCRRLGTFDTAEEAAGAYDAAAIKLHGTAAKTNFKSPAAPVADDINPGHVQIIGLKQAPVAVNVNSNIEGQRSAVARSDSRSGFRGVRLYRGKYLVQIREPRRPTTRLQLGIFDSVEEAARAYDAAALKMYGAAAKTNFGQPLTTTTADDGEESSMDLLNDLPELPVRSWTISVGEEVEEFLKGFTADVVA